MTESAAAEPADNTEKKTQAKQSAAELAAETLGLDLLEALVNEFGQATAWKGMTENQRQVVIDRLRMRVQKLVTDALRILFVGEYPACRAVLESITVKEGVKVALKVARTEHHLLELAEHVGTPVVLLMHDPQQYFERMEQVRAEKDQGDLFDASGNLKVADEAPAGDPPDTAEQMPPFWRQAQIALGRISIPVPDEEAQAWTAAQATEIAYWVKMVEDAPTKAPPAPKFVTIPAGWKRPRKRS